MAKKIITKITDDIDGSDGAETVEFGLDGVAYTIDLSERNSQKLREILDTYIQAGTRLRAAPPQRHTRSSAPTLPNMAAGNQREQNQMIREWAASTGYQLAERGRIPQHIQDAYTARNNATTVIAAVKKSSGAKQVGFKHAARVSA